MDHTQIMRQIKSALALVGKNYSDVARHAGVSKQAVCQGLKLCLPPESIRKAVEEVSGLSAADLWHL